MSFRKVLLIVRLFFITLTLNLYVNLNAQEKTKPEDLFKMSLEDLLRVEITTAGKKPEQIGDTPASMVLIARKEIEEYGFTHLGEILENISGLYRINDYTFKYNYGWRGYWSDLPNRNILIMVNDVEQIGYFCNDHDIDKINVPVEAIDRIEIVRGPGSVIYGHGAFFGVINIYTNKSEDRKYENLITGSTNLGKTNRIAIQLTGNRNFSILNLN